MDEFKGGVGGTIASLNRFFEPTTREKEDEECSRQKNSGRTSDIDEDKDEKYVKSYE